MSCWYRLQILRWKKNLVRRSDELFHWATISIMILISHLFLVILEHAWRQLLTELHNAKCRKRAQGLVLAQNSKLPQRVMPWSKVKPLRFLGQLVSSVTMACLRTSVIPTDIVRVLTRSPSWTRYKEAMDWKYLTRLSGFWRTSSSENANTKYRELLC